MDRSKSRSTPHLPRYQSLSPARSPLLGARRFTSLRSVSQPTQRIFYIDNSPARIINSYHVHHSPSPHRTYKIHLSSSKTNHFLTRTTRSQSAYDINSSHLYTSQENIFNTCVRETTSRVAGSCEDIYHKAPFFPDVTPSESGVSFGESEEGSAFGGEDDNVSQHSFDSSSAFYEITADSELDKCDSDNFSGPDCIGDRSLGTLHENSLYENEKRKRWQDRAHHEAQSPDSSRTSPISRAESRKREFQRENRFSTPPEALKVIIPDSETCAKTSRDISKGGDRKVMSSTPLAHSTPHVSPGGPEEMKLHVHTSWNADDPFREVRGYSEIRQPKTVGASFEHESETKHPFKLEDSSCNSSCSEDNYSDVSNVTVSSIGQRKTKLVKKHSDKPASAKRTPLSYLRNLSDITHSEIKESDSSNKSVPQHANITLGPIGSEESGGFSYGQVNPGNNNDQVVTHNIKHDEQISKEKSGKDWWDSYNISTNTEREITVQSEKYDFGDKLFGSERRVSKPLKVNIPLISAGKHGQEKLRQLSQTFQSPNRSPTLSPREESQTWDHGKNKINVTEDKIQTNIDSRQESFEHQLLRGLMAYDNWEYGKYHVGDDEEDKQVGFPTSQESSSFASNSTLDGLNERESPLNGKAPQSEQCFESVIETSGPIHLQRKEVGMSPVLVENNRNISEVTQLEDVETSHVIEKKERDVSKVANTQERVVSSIQVADNMTCTSDSLSSHNFGISCEATSTVNTSMDISTREINCPAEVKSASGTLVQKARLLATEQVINVERVTDICVNEGTDLQLGVYANNDELDSAGGNLHETWKTVDSSRIPVLATQVFKSSSPVDGTSLLALAGNKLDAEKSVSKQEIVRTSELSEREVHVTVTKENKCAQVDENTVNSLEEANSLDNDINVCQGQASFELCSQSASCQEHVDDNVVALSQSCTIVSDDSKSFQTTVISDSLFVKPSSIVVVIDPITGTVISKPQEQLEQKLSCSSENTPAVEFDISTENIGMANCMEPDKGTNQSHTEFSNITQMVVHVPTTHISEDSVKNNESSLHRNASMNHHLPSSVPSSNGPANNSDRTALSGVLNALSDYSNSNPQISNISDDNTSLQVSGETNYSPRQQGGLGTTNNCTDILRPAGDESIQRPSYVAQRGDKGFNKEEHFYTENFALFVDRGEEIIHCPTQQQRSVLVTGISSSRVEHTHIVTTAESAVTSEQRIGISSQDIICGSDSVDIVANREADVETIVKDDGDYAISTPDAVYTNSRKIDSVSIVAAPLDINIITRCLPLSSIPKESQLVLGQEICNPIHSTVSTLQPCTYSSSVSTTHLTAQTAAPTIHVLKVNCDNLNIYKDPTQQVCSAVTDISHTNNAEELLVSEGCTFSAAMNHDDPLDNLHSQLSLISNDQLSTRLNVSNDGDQYRDHAEATSVLKQIVRGDVSDFTHFSNTRCESVDSENFQDCFTARASSVVVSGELHNANVTGVESHVDASVIRECYDNDYDYVTTDLPKGTKGLFPKPHHQLHLSKPGQFKTSSLWTLQEETESAMNTLSPKPSPKMPRVTSTSQEDNCNHSPALSPPTQNTNMTTNKLLNIDNVNIQFNHDSVYGNMNLGSDSSDFEGSDGNYTSISTADTDSRRSSSFGREQTPLSETESAAMDSIDNRIVCQDFEEVSKGNYGTNIFSEHLLPEESEGFNIGSVNKSPISLTDTEDRVSLRSCSREEVEQSESHMSTFKSSLALSVSNPEVKKDNLSPLDKLFASLEQFNTTDGSNDSWRLLIVTERASSASDSRDIDMSTSSIAALQSLNNDAASESPGRHTFDFDTSRVSPCESPTPTDFSEGSLYTCTGSAEIKKKSSFHYDMPAYTTKANLTSDLKKTQDLLEEDKIRDEKIKQFENLLDEFSKSILPSGVISEFIFLREKRSDRLGSPSSPASSSEDLYTTFTNDDSEKKQNHVCIVVEDENMNTLRFKRYLKKSHTNRKKGKKVIRFLSKLGCVSESLNSPISSPSRHVKHADEHSTVFSIDSLSKPISNPIHINATSFHHRQILNSAPLKYTDECSTPFSSNQSLDSTRSRGDSAYSSFSESVVGSLNSPSFQRASFRVPPASSGSVSSVFYSGSTSGDWSVSDNVFSSNADVTMPTAKSIGKDDFTHHHPGGPDNDMMTALSDVFDQLNVCEDEIDSALLNRLRHGHIQADTDTK